MSGEGNKPGPTFRRPPTEWGQGSSTNAPVSPNVSQSGSPYGNNNSVRSPGGSMGGLVRNDCWKLGAALDTQFESGFNAFSRAFQSCIKRIFMFFPSIPIIFDVNNCPAWYVQISRTNKMKLELGFEDTEDDAPDFGIEPSSSEEDEEEEEEDDDNQEADQFHS